MLASGYYGISGLIILILDIWALVSVLTSGKEVGEKVLWVLLIILLPLIGFILWLIMGPRGSKL